MAAKGAGLARRPRQAQGSPREGALRSRWGTGARASRPQAAWGPRRAGRRRQGGPTSGGATRQRRRCGPREARAGREGGRGGARRSRTPCSSGRRPRRRGPGAAADRRQQALDNGGACAARPGGARHHPPQRPQGRGHRRASRRRRGWHRSTTFPHVARRHARPGRVGGGHRGKCAGCWCAQATVAERRGPRRPQPRGRRAPTRAPRHVRGGRERRCGGKLRSGRPSGPRGHHFSGELLPFWGVCSSKMAKHKKLGKGEPSVGEGCQCRQDRRL